jgi:hypothetical protein
VSCLAFSTEGGAARHGEAVTCSGTYRFHPAHTARVYVSRIVVTTNCRVFLKMSFIFGHYQLPSFVFKTFLKLGSFPSSGKNPVEFDQIDKASDIFLNSIYRIIFVMER